MKTVLDVVRELLDLALNLLPTEQVKEELDAAAVRRANAVADTAEEIKFGSHPADEHDP